MSGMRARTVGWRRRRAGAAVVGVALFAGCARQPSPSPATSEATPEPDASENTPEPDASEHASEPEAAPGPDAVGALTRAYQAFLATILEPTGWQLLGGDHDILEASQVVRVVGGGEVGIHLVPRHRYVADAPTFAPETVDLVDEVELQLGSWSTGRPAAAIFDCVGYRFEVAGDDAAAVEGVARALVDVAECVDEPPATDGSLRDGRVAGYLTGLDVETRSLDVNVVQWLSGERARRVYAEQHPDDPSGPPNDYLILDEDAATWTLPVSDAVTVELVRLHADSNAELGPGTWDELPDYLAGYAPGDGRLSYNPFWITVHDGTVVGIQEQYVP